jgi:Lon protease-like protein
MSATVLRPLCVGRCARGRVVTVAPRADGRHQVLVIALQPVRVVTEITTDYAPTRADQLRFLEGIQ